MEKKLPNITFFKAFQKRITIFLIVFSLLGVVGSFVFVQKLHSQKSTSSKSLVIKKPTIQLASKDTYKDLPVANVKTYSVEKAKGTVIFIPQYHKSPGSDVNAKINDAGAITQQEMYKILTFLVKTAGIDFVMTEGNLYGELPVEKIALLADKIAKRNKLVAVFDELKKKLQTEGQASTTEEEFIKSLTSEIGYIDRAIILEGAGEKLKAEGTPFTLYGAETQTTREEAKRVLQDYIFLKDRIAQLSHTSENRTNFSALLPQNTSSLIQTLLQQAVKPQFLQFERQLERNGEKDIAGVVEKIQDAYDLVKKAPEQIIVTAAEDTPTLNDSPYKTETDIKYLQEKMDTTKQQVEAVIIEKRNRDTAENFVKALQEKNESVGILEFGAGHKEGIIKELNKQGLSVIIVTPQEVSQRESE